MGKWIGLIALGFAVFGISYSYSKRFLDWLRFQSLGTRDYIVDKLSQMFIVYDPNQILLGLFVLSLGMGGFVFVIFLPNVIPGLIFGALATVVGWKSPKPVVNYIYQKRIQKFVIQMVDGLGLMANGLKSGLSVAQSIGLVVNELDDPIRKEFSFVLEQTRLGASLEDSLISLSKRIINDDVEMFVTAINILKDTGGNLAETFDTISLTIRERVKVEKRIEAMTSSGFIQGMFVLALIPIMGFMLFQTDPTYMEPLFSNPIGWLVLLTIVGLMAIGFVVIMKIIKIDV